MVSGGSAHHEHEHGLQWLYRAQTPTWALIVTETTNINMASGSVGPLPKTMLVFVVRVTTGTRGCPWSMLPPRAMVVFINLCCRWWPFCHSAARNHVEVHDPGSLWLLRARKILLLWYRWLQTDNWEWETLKAFVANTPPPQIRD